MNILYVTNGLKRKMEVKKKTSDKIKSNTSKIHKIDSDIDDGIYINIFCIIISSIEILINFNLTS